MADLPEGLRHALASDTTASSVFEALAPSNRNDYLEWIAGAKKPPMRR